jgi:hypothetical protein
LNLWVFAQSSKILSSLYFSKTRSTNPERATFVDLIGTPDYTRRSSPIIELSELVGGRLAPHDDNLHDKVKLASGR